MATRMQQRRGTAEQWALANPVLTPGEIGFETDTSKFKVGDGVNAWADLAYFVNSDDLSGELGDYATQEYVDTAIENVVGLAPETLDTLAELATALGDDPAAISTLQSDVAAIPAAIDTAKQEAVALSEGYTDAEITGLESAINGTTSQIIQDADALSTEVQGISTSLTDLSGDVDNLSGVVSGHTSDISGIITDIEGQNTAIGTINDALLLKSPLENPTFTGTVTLPTTTLVGDVTSAEIGHLAGVTDSIQDQIDAKLDSGVASGTYAPLNDPTFGGTVSLPATTSIGEISSTELGYLDGVTSSIQTQLSNLDTAKANVESPTFTGTVSGVTSSMVGLGNVDDTSDANKPVSTAQQAALDAKLALAGGTMTGKITLDGDPTQALHAVTKQYVDSVEAGLITRPAVKAATTSNLSGTYDNGTAGVDATLNLGQLSTLDIDGVTSWSQWNGILVKNQTNGFENGRYVVSQIGNDTDTDWILKRCPLCDEADEIPGSYIFVTDGTVNEQTGWVQHVADPATFTVGTDNISVYQFAGAGSITAGTNVSVDGNQVSVVDAPVFTGIVDASAAGVNFSDGVQTQVGVASITSFSEKTESYQLDTLDHKDNVVEMNVSTAATFTVPLDATLSWPVGASMDVFATGSGEITIAGEAGVTLNATPGLKLRTQWSSATIMKRGPDSWVVYGDLKA
jgi:hypothetical protein